MKAALAVAFILGMAGACLAIDVWPQTTVSLQASGAVTDRGTPIASDACYGAAASMSYDPVTIDIDGMMACGSDRARLTDYVWASRVAVALSDGPISLDMGFHGTFFESSPETPFDRYEVFLSAEKRFARGLHPRLEFKLLSDLDNDMALYGRLEMGGTVIVSDSVDLDLGISAGYGDEQFSERHASHMVGDAPDYWSDIELEVACPLMVGSLEVTPRVSYIRVLGDSARELMESNEVDADGWQFGIEVKMYLD